MAQIQITIDNEKQLDRNLRIAVEGIKDMRSFFKEVTEIVRKRIDDIFSSGGNSIKFGQNWPKLSPVTRALRRRRIGYYKASASRPGILRWTGKMQSSKRIVATNSQATVTMTDQRVAKHHFGARVPERRVIDIDDNTSTSLTKALQVKINNDIGIFGKQL